MGKNHKGAVNLSHISCCILVMLVLLEIYQTSAASHLEKSDTNRHSRRKRQAADFILMGYKAQRAIKGTTRPSEFFRRIGKKWAGSPSLRENDLILRPGFDEEHFLDSDDKPQEW